MTDHPPSKRADATRNRQRILDVARTALVSTGAVTSMADIARRAGVGSATLYRNFATRHALLEALLADGADEISAAAAAAEGDSPADRLMTWLRRLAHYIGTERPVVVELLEQTDRTDPVFEGFRDRMLAAGRPLLSAAQDAHQITGGLDFGQVLDLVVAIAKIPGSPEYRQPIFDAAFAGLRPRGT